MIKNLQKLLGAIIIITDLSFFGPLTYEILNSGGGSFGFGIMLLPITVIALIFFVPAIRTWTKMDDKNNQILIAIILGAIWNLFWMVLFLTTPK